MLPNAEYYVTLNLIQGLVPAKELLNRVQHDVAIIESELLLLAQM